MTDAVNVAGCGPIPIGPRTPDCPTNGAPCQLLATEGAAACFTCQERATAPAADED